MSDSKRKGDASKSYYEVPLGYSVVISGGPLESGGLYVRSSQGECFVQVYRSLDRGESFSSVPPQVQHVVPVGSFRIDGTDEMKASDFLREMREGLERVIKAHNF